MDVILFLLKAITTLSIALAGLAFNALRFLLARFGHTLAKRAHQQPPQQAPQPATPNAAPPPATAPTDTPPIHVHVHMPPPDTPRAPAPGGRSTTALDRPDHRIYVTTGSHLMMEHPYCDDLLDQLDYHLYLAAHRNGDPFEVAPALDASTPSGTVGLTLPPLTPTPDGEFFSEERHALPPPDGLTWVRKLGHAPQRLEANTTA